MGTQNHKFFSKSISWYKFKKSHWKQVEDVKKKRKNLGHEKGRRRVYLSKLTFIKEECKNKQNTSSTCSKPHPLQQYYAHEPLDYGQFWLCLYI